MNSEPRGRLIDNKADGKRNSWQIRNPLFGRIVFPNTVQKSQYTDNAFQIGVGFSAVGVQRGTVGNWMGISLFLFSHICLKVEPVCVRKKGLTLGAQHEIPFLSLLSSNAKCANYPRKLTAEPNDRNLLHSPNQLAINPTQGGLSG